MNLIYFLTILIIFTINLGEFGKYPFGVSSTGVSLLDVLLALALIFLIIWQTALKKKILFPPNFKLLMFFWVVGFIALVLFQNMSGIFYLIRFVIYSSTFWLGFALSKESKISSENLIMYFVFSGWIFAVLGFVQLWLLPDLRILSDLGFDPHQNRLVSTFLDPNFAGSFLNMALVLNIYLWKKSQQKKWLIGVLILILSIILTFSRSAYLMLAIEAIILGVYLSRKILIGIVICGLVLYVFIPRLNQRINGAFALDTTAQERIISWQKGLLVFQKYPLFGVGFNNIRVAYERENLFKTFTEDGGHSGAGVDSSLIFVLATTGITGCSIYLIWWLLILKRLVEKIKSKSLEFYLLTILVALFINSFFINSLFFPSIMFGYFLLLGLVF